MSDLRFACIRLPSFALRHFVHRQEEIHHAGLYVCQDKRRIVSIGECAYGAGVRPQHTESEIRQRYPNIALFESDEATWLERLNEAKERLETVTPHVEYLKNYSGTFMLDMRGMEGLGGESAFVGRLRSVTESMGYSLPRIGVTSQWHSAVAALGRTSREMPVIHVDACREKEFVAALYIDELQFSPSLTQGLISLGLRQVSMIHRIPKKSLIQRFGVEAQELYDLLNGVDPRTFKSTFSFHVDPVEWVLDAPVWSIEHLKFGLYQMCRALTDNLIKAVQRTASIQLDLLLDDQSTISTEIELSHAVANTEMIFNALGSRLGTQRFTSLSSPVIGLILNARRLSTLAGDQESFSAGRWHSGDVEKLLLMLQSRNRTPLVFTTQKRTAPHPDFRYRWVPLSSLKELPETPKKCMAFHEPKTLRRTLSPPLPIHVETDAEQKPREIETEQGRFLVDVVSRFRSSGGWWCSESYAFEDFGVVDRTGALKWLRHDLRRKVWLLKGGWD